MVEYSITITVHPGIDDDSIEWAIKDNGFSPSIVEVVGALERVKFLFQIGRHVPEDIVEIDDEEEGEDGENNEAYSR